jgi:hypothetical protein
MVCGKSCLAGDIFGEFDFPEELEDRRPDLDPGRRRLHNGQEELV